jgi:hypothetical protein
MPVAINNLDLNLQNMIRSADIIPGAAEKHYICASGQQPATYWRSRAKGDRFHGTIAAAHSAMTTGRNDVALLSPDSHSQAAGITWSKNMCHLVGSFGPAMQNHRSRIGHSADFASLLTVSGYGNTLANLYFMHGRGSATNVNALKVTGNRNSFIRCHFGGPLHATEGDAAAYALVQLDAAETYFEKCFFGIDTTAFSGAGCLVKFGNEAEPPRSIFKDCIFMMIADATAPFFLNVEAGAGAGAAVFQNCLFLNIGSSSLAYAINGAGLGNFKMFFDLACSFAGVSEIVEVAYEASVFCGGVNMAVNQVNTASSKLFNMMATNPDVS